jgi:GrpB-like predicted nucleotidyltransferase (UPF0157 family)
MGSQGPDTARRIEVVPYDPGWPALFQAEAARLAAALGDEAIAIHHIGSTAIPGAQAKPTLDILVEVRAIERADGAAAGALVALGYEPRGESGIPGRRYFVKRAGSAHTCHLHVFAVGHSEVERHLRFRDYLRAHPEEARAYGRLKVDLARRFPHDGPRYTEGKDAFVAEIDGRAAAWARAGQ